MTNEETLATCIDITFCGSKYCIEIPTDLSKTDIEVLKNFISKVLVSSKMSQVKTYSEEVLNDLSSETMKTLFEDGFMTAVIEIRESVEPKLIEDMQRPDVDEEQTKVPQNNKWIKRGIYAAIGLGVVFGALKFFKK